MDNDKRQDDGRDAFEREVGDCVRSFLGINEVALRTFSLAGQNLQVPVLMPHVLKVLELRQTAAYQAAVIGRLDELAEIGARALARLEPDPSDPLDVRALAAFGAAHRMAAAFGADPGTLQQFLTATQDALTREQGVVMELFALLERLRRVGAGDQRAVAEDLDAGFAGLSDAARAELTRLRMAAEAAEAEDAERAGA